MCSELRVEACFMQEVVRIVFLEAPWRQPAGPAVFQPPLL